MLGMDEPLYGDRQLPRARARLHDNIVFPHAALGEFCKRARYQRLDDGCVPARVDNGNAQRRAVGVLWRGAFEGGHL